MEKLLLLLAAVAAFFAGSAEAGWVDPSDPWVNLAEPVFVNHLSEGGLPRATVTALAQDRDGFLWVGTQNGLARWDGYRAKLYQQNRAEPGALPDDYVLGLHLDMSGRLWVATSAGGLARYNPADDDFVMTDIGPGGISSSAVSAVEDDGGGGLWVGTDIALDHLGPDDHALAHLHPGKQGRVRALLKDRKGSLWIGTEAGLYRLDASNPEPVQIAGVDAAVYALAEDKQDRIWVGTKKKGVKLVAPGGDEASPLPAGSATDWVISMAESPAGEMWLATYGDGLIIVDRTATHARRIRHDGARPSSPADDTIWAMLSDRSGLMWIGGNGGLTHTNPDQAGLLNIFGERGRPAPLSDSEVWSSLATSDGRTWIGLARSGVDILDAQGHQAGRLVPDLQHPDRSLPDAPILALAEADHGTLWVGTYLGLYRTDLAAHALQRIPLDAGKDRSAATALYFDGKVLWLGSHQGGLWRLDPNSGRILSYETGDRLTDGRIQTLAPAADGKLWIGTRNGLNRLDPQSGEVLRIPAAVKDPAGLAGGFVTSMVTDRHGRLWVATFGGGISVLTDFDGEGRARFRTLGYGQGLPNTNVDQLLIDRAGRVWAGTDDGIAVIDPETFAVRALQRAQGALLSVCTTGSGTLLADGSPLFGSLGGALLVRPDKLMQAGADSPVAFTAILAGGRAVPAGRYTGKHELVIEPERNSLAAEFASLNFADPSKARFAYQLEGFDREWTETDATRRLAAYTNLPPGRYVLRIRSIEPDGSGSGGQAALYVRVLPAWYQSWPARTLFAALAVGAIALLVRIRTSHLRRSERALQRIVEQRTAALTAQSAELLETNRKLEVISTTDRLTGAYNRLYLDNTLASELLRSQRTGRAFSVVLIDMDKFKSVNDEFGHLVGDKVLIHLVAVLSAHIRKTDILGRWGGEEFLIICPETPETGAAEMAEALRHAVEDASFPVVGRKTISVGVATVRGQETVEDLVGRADAALYQAKNGGRNKVVAALVP